MRLSIYIPKSADNIYGITAGSAIVGKMNSTDETRTILYYEGNLYNIENLKSFNQRLHQAASRAVSNYPTVARISLTLRELQEHFQYSGEYDYHTHQVDIPNNSKALEDWANGLEITA